MVRLIWLILSTILLGCTLSTNINDLGSKDADYSNSSITVTNPGIADGATPVTITITLRNGNQPIPNFTPQFISSGSGNTPSACSISSSAGISTCLLRSTVAEVKTLVLTLPPVAATTSVTFDPPSPSKPGIAITSGGGLSSGPGILSHSSIGLPTNPVVLKDASSPTTLRARTGLHGAIFEE